MYLDMWKSGTFPVK